MERAEAEKMQAVKARPPKIKAGMTAAEGFQAIARACVAHLLANEPILRERRNPQALHQLRVAVRRLRAALSIFRDMVDGEDRDRLDAELRWAASQLGNARDLDVYIETTLKPARQQDPQHQALAEHAAQVETRRNHAYAEALSAIDSPRFRGAVLDLSAWVEAGPWLSARGGKASHRRDRAIEDFAASELAWRAKKIRKRGEHLAALDAAERHRLRIAVKKLRYAVEFLSPTFAGKTPTKRAKVLRNALAELQDRLGLLNDIAVAEIIRDPSGEEEGPVARLLAERDASRFHEHLPAAENALAHFAGAEPFWR